MTAYLIVRAQVKDSTAKDDFDRWYGDEHLPDALRAFKALSAQRGWSRLDPLVHYAYYEFPDAASAAAIQGSPEMKHLIAEFDRAWGDRVTRVRDIVELTQSLSAS